MRIGVHFDESEPVRVPINQNYFLASAIYSVLEARPDYARFLHDHGYTHEPSGRAFKLFVFSPLMSKRRRAAGETLLLGPGRITWIISSPMTEFVTALAEGLLSRGEIEMRGTRLAVGTVEALPDPEFRPEMKFTCLSPIVISKTNEEGGHAHYLLHDDPELSDRVKSNLIRKYELVHGRPPEDTRFEMAFDQDYVQRKEGKVSKLIDIRGIRIRGIFAPFEVKGSVELMRVGYECGFGERNSMGFGMVAVDFK